MQCAVGIKGGFLVKIYLVVCLFIFHNIEQVKIWSTEDITTHETGDIACRDLLMN